MDQNDVINKHESSSSVTPNGHIEEEAAETPADFDSIADKASHSSTTNAKPANIQNPDSRNSSFCDSDIEEEGSCEEDDHGNSGDESDLEDNPEQPTVERVSRSANPELPDTVTVLKADNGAKVYIVGTAHFSKNSQDDVAKTIQLTQPDVVVVELCSSRVGILQLNEEKLLEEAKNINFEKFRSLVRQAGMIQGVVHILLLSLSAHLTEQLGMAPGGEFRRALQEAQKIPGCHIQLGDRPVGITLRRAIYSLSLWQKIQLMWCLLTSKEPISKEEVERCKQHDLLEEMMREMAGEFPALSRVFVKERDLYLVHSLRQATQPMPRASEAGDFGPPVVVGIVGIGHVQGIVENWNKDFNIQELLRVPEGSRIGYLVKRTFQAALVGLVSWGCFKLYEHLPRLPL
ncbi:hypothetical protein LSH36_646g01023 [Paralvinella palmiformis]|uniref:TraB domain-containing protein n=1 Tax=Paralvinella palmiformis TaxID=53620 RepID=A0AAD9J3G9_9ANNE|nr:hypothetical protein LSH36_646g01023 [Paralvinella palmiformis]